MTCKDCIHSKVCRYSAQPDICFGGCSLFKDKSRFIELPCKGGDTVYQTDGTRIYESKIEKIIFETKAIAFDESAIGKTVFLAREEAEKALKGEKYDAEQ